MGLSASAGSTPEAQAQAQGTGETLKDKAERLRLRLGLPDDGTPIFKIVELAGARLGINRIELAAVPSIVMKLDLCLQRANMLAEPAMAQPVMPMAQPVVPMGQVVIPMTAAEFVESPEVVGEFVEFGEVLRPRRGHARRNCAQGRLRRRCASWRRRDAPARLSRRWRRSGREGGGG